ncbi:MAG: hypothetical protein ACI9KE_006708 [Polyangiales bacterium]|jgi:hypothetical protein
MRACLLLSLGLGLLACGEDTRRPGRDVGTVDAASDAIGDVGTDGGIPDVPSMFDATCAAVQVEAEVDNRPVDIIWVVDNSTSMEPAITNVQAGLNDFARRVDASGLDYRVIMLSLRGTGASTRYPICIPPPLAGDGECGDGERFYHVSVDIRSTQPIEQILGTLGQTAGYRTEDGDRGSEPWLDLLRPDATKTVVVATDDNSRTCARPHTNGVNCNGGDPVLTATSLEVFPGGGNPFNSNDLGPGFLTPTYGDLFEGYTFNAIYGWGNEGDDEATCTYPDGSSPPNSGTTYTALVTRTGGVRAQICQQSMSSAWDTFFEAIATRVAETARLSCEIALPRPPDGMVLDPAKVNVVLNADSAITNYAKVASAAECGASGGWYYDNEDSPSQVILCPASCDNAQLQLGESGTAEIGVQFGCDSLLI